MNPIRNVCFARGVVPTVSAEYVYTVPAGYVLLFKSAYFRPQGTGETAIQVYAFSADGSANVIVYEVPASGSNPPAWEGWLALNAGDQVYVSAPAAAMWYWLSGALLPYAAALPAMG
jgi:hypothetical protein